MADGRGRRAVCCARFEGGQRVDGTRQGGCQCRGVKGNVGTGRSSGAGGGRCVWPQGLHIAGCRTPGACLYQRVPLAALPLLLLCRRVQNLFHSVQLNVNNPHFLIMQGRITKARRAAGCGQGTGRRPRSSPAQHGPGPRGSSLAACACSLLRRLLATLLCLHSTCCLLPASLPGAQYEASGDPGSAGGGGRHQDV